jgi:hypothetical protein
VIAGNEAALQLGLNYGTPNIPVSNTVIEEHTGSVSFRNEINTTDNRNQQTTINYTLATPLTEGQVGPAGLSGASTAYKDARGL